MKKSLLVAGLTTLALTLSGCNLNIFNKKARYTIMVYMCGSDLESGYDGNSVDPLSAGLASADLFEMVSTFDKPKNVNIIVETGGSKAWRNQKINPKKLGRWHVEDRNLVQDEELNNANMGGTKTFQDFLEWGLTKYPAKKTGVIMWNHGGAMQGVCSDENYLGDTLLCSEVTEALKNAFKNTKQKGKLEWIGYDACLMQVQDVAEANSDYFNYMVGAQESESGTGWKYDAWLDNLFEGESEEKIFTEICDTFVKSVYSGSNNQTLSAINLNKMPAYKEAMEKLATSIANGISTSEKKSFQDLLKTCKTYGSEYHSASYLSENHMSTNPSATNYYGNYGLEKYEGGYILPGYNTFGVLDAKDVLNKLKTNYPYLSSDVDKAIAAYNDMLVYNRVGSYAGNSNGLSLFFPLHNRCSAHMFYNANQTRFNNWRNLTGILGES